MSNSKLTSEFGTLIIGEKFISVRLIKDVLQKYNGISVLEEKADFIKCRVFRIGRLFGGPWPGPYPTISYKIERSNNNTVLRYQYFWPEYYMIPFSAVAFGLIAGISTFFKSESFVSGAKIGLITAAAVTVFTTLCIHLDVLYYKKLIRKRLNERP